MWSSFLKSGRKCTVFKFIEITIIENDKSAKKIIGSFRVSQNGFENVAVLLEAPMNLLLFNFVGVMKIESLFWFFEI